MNVKLILLIVGGVFVGAVIVGLAIQDAYLVHKIRVFEKKNAQLRRENIGLMKHNGKLYDENFRLKNGIEEENIPDFKPW